ncbi:uncharacterized protein B0H18DRAFT_877657 [Fomitopsis serialis]|uniref:uncharacterized protein n=1 Tax=Fomitopsis serialis TaxID=139415 RepID=UPI002008A1FC|nr:uncharacterized protein B0H18DRAFT_877657 [Neoantrodia serialis]KAH9924739.1 hypothetical protein B0H18DRAFT_877657 [Neoantrodia serialis]
MATSRSLYDILGITQTASADAVRKAYKLQALQTHPDKLPVGTLEAEVEAAKARFREVRTAFEVLSDPAKRRAYDNGLEYFADTEMRTKLAQAKLARERAEWARQAELRHQERMRVLREEVLASQKRYQETMAKAELRYQERVCALEEELTAKREAERREEASMRGESVDMAEDMLQELRNLNPEWEARRKEVLRVSCHLGLARFLSLRVVEAASGENEEDREAAHASIAKRACVPLTHLSWGLDLMLVFIRLTDADVVNNTRHKRYLYISVLQWTIDLHQNWSKSVIPLPSSHGTYTT